MWETAVVMELKTDYALVMARGGEILRLVRKPGMRPGQTIYFLPEDRYALAAEPLPFPTGAQRRRWGRRLAGLAAALVLVVLMAMPSLHTTAYAVASFDGQNSLQMQLDRNNTILSAVSPDGTIDREALDALVGRDLLDLGPALQELLGGRTFLVGYAPRRGTADEEMENALRTLLPDGETVVLSGGRQEIQDAGESRLSLGQYMAGLRVGSGDADLDELDDLALRDLLAMLETDEQWMQVPEFREALEERYEDLEDDRDETGDDLDDDAEEDEGDEEDEKEEEDDDEDDEEDDD